MAYSSMMKNIRISVRRKEQIWNVVDVNIIKRIIANTSVWSCQKVKHVRIARM